MSGSSGSPKQKIRIGISSCLLGESVRFDGGHKRDLYLTGILAQFVEWVPVCPEVEVGMGTPRESLHLIGSPEAPRMVTVRSNIDYTDPMLKYAHARIEQLQPLNLNGYILKKDSPSCGMERVRIYAGKGAATRNGTGLFARVLMEAMPNLPVEEEGRLNDARLRESFIVRIFCHHRWQALLHAPFRLNHLIRFHAQHKYLIMAHSEKHLRELGKLVAGAKSYRPKELQEAYAQLLFSALKHPATTRRHTNVLNHIAGYFKKQLDDVDRKELHTMISDYHRGLIPLVVPVTLIKHHLNRIEVPYLMDQVYLNPHPKELMLLNHV